MVAKPPGIYSCETERGASCGREEPCLVCEGLGSDLQDIVHKKYAQAGNMLEDGDGCKCVMELVLLLGGSTR